MKVQTIISISEVSCPFLVNPLRITADRISIACFCTLWKITVNTLLCLSSWIQYCVAEIHLPLLFHACLPGHACSFCQEAFGSSSMPHPGLARSLDCSSSLDSDKTLLLWETYLVALDLNPSSSTYQLNGLANVTNNLFMPHFWLKIIVSICQSSCEFQVRKYLVNT